MQREQVYMHAYCQTAEKGPNMNIGNKPFKPFAPKVNHGVRLKASVA
jgi:hypothetical protein